MATTNRYKIAELKRILSDSGIQVMALAESDSTEKIENGSSFAENALLKARYYQRLQESPTIADDSGLEVKVLGGAPGLHSARYAGPTATDEDRIARLLEEMKDVDDSQRWARFVCAAAMVWEGGEKVFLAEVQGSVLRKPRGENGFGFDPIFFYQPLGKTFAELTVSEKATVSHRGQAFRALVAWLTESGVLDTPRSNDRIVITAD
ncbi:MAG: RdgB/HAM1 family non-canonical purine NTP pyrophosphatase [Blastocatellia bacterium]